MKELNALSKQIIAIYMQELRTDIVLPTDNFIDLGGDSLNGMKIKIGIKKTFDVDVPLENIMFDDEIQDTMNFLSKIKKNDSSKLENNRLREVVQYTRQNSAFYKKHFDDVPSEFSLTDLPFTTKADLQKNGLDMCSMSMDEVAVYYETTGTTGKPTPCPRSKNDIDISNGYVQRSVSEIFNNTFGTTNALTAIMGPSELYAFGDTYGEVCRNLNIPYVRLWPESPRVGLTKAASLVLKLEVKVLICSPATALALAKQIEKLGVSVEKTTVKQILLLGELCTSEMLNNISEIWNANCTHGLYGSQEIHSFATGCSKGNLHISESNYIVELDKDSQIDNFGELCVTMLSKGAKPLIRFKTGDIVSIEKNICECGNCNRVVKVLGRKTDMVTISNVDYFPYQVESFILKQFKKVLGYQCKLLKKEEKEELYLNITTQVDSVDIKKIQKEMNKKFNINVTINVEQNLEARTETGSYISWKYARIKDLRNEENSMES